MCYVKVYHHKSNWNSIHSIKVVLYQEYSINCRPYTQTHKSRLFITGQPNTNSDSQELKYEQIGISCLVQSFSKFTLIL